MKPVARCISDAFQCYVEDGSQIGIVPINYCRIDGYGVEQQLFFRNLLRFLIKLLTY